MRLSVSVASSYSRAIFFQDLIQSYILATLVGCSSVFVCPTAGQTTAEPDYCYIVCNRFLAIVELKLAPFVYILLLFYLSYDRLLL